MRGSELMNSNYCFLQTQSSVFAQLAIGLLQIHPGLSGQIVELLVLFAIMIALVAIKKVAEIKIIFFMIIIF